MKYICLIYGSESDGPAAGSAEQHAMYAAYGAVTQEMQEAGVLVDASELESPGAATTVRVRNGEAILTDGPFAEIKEHLGGYYVLECGDLDDAVKWASKIPGAAAGGVEVRPLRGGE